jgi:3-oxoacyl-[acyl-carrier protein] reductase
MVQFLQSGSLQCLQGTRPRIRPNGIRVNAICPVLVPTQLASNFVPGFENTPEYRAKAAQLFQIPLGRLTTAEDVVNTALWLASAESSFITGTDQNVDGGRSI